MQRQECFSAASDSIRSIVFINYAIWATGSEHLARVAALLLRLRDLLHASVSKNSNFNALKSSWQQKIMPASARRRKREPCERACCANAFSRMGEHKTQSCTRSSRKI